MAQMDLTSGYDSNLAKTEALIKAAAANHSALVLLPELFAWEWFPAAESSLLFDRAEPERGATLETVRQWATDNNIIVVAPLYERDGDRRFNTTYVISRAGHIVGKYRKNHIPYHAGWYEKFYYGPGDLGFPVFHMEGLTIGIQTCWDNLFPEGSRLLALAGVDVILAPRATGAHTTGRWRTALTANAQANGCFVATANRFGREGGQYEFGGDSFIVSPLGEVLASAPLRDGVVAATVDSAEVALARKEWPFLSDRRPQLYRRVLREDRS